MTLDQYLKTQGVRALTSLSEKVSVSKGRLSQLRNSTDWPADLALKVEAATDGALDASELSPTIALARQAA